MKNPEMFKFFPDPFKTEKVFEHAVEKQSYLIRYVTD